MKSTLIVISIYWVVVICATYIIRHVNGNNPKSKFIQAIVKPEKSFWKEARMHLKIVFLCPLLLPFGGMVFGIDGIHKLYLKTRYKNIPRPMPMKTRAFLKKDLVLDEKGNVVTLIEYNSTHNTDYTLDQIYGNGYEESLSDEDKSQDTMEKEKLQKLQIDDNLPDNIYTTVSCELGKAIETGDYGNFSAYLDDNVELVIYERKTIRGKQEVEDYWKDWRKRHIETNQIKDIEAVYSYYFARTCLLLQTMIVMTEIKNGNIVKMLMAPRHIAGDKHHDDLVGCSPYNLNYIRTTLQPLKEGDEINKENRLWCPSCGAHSESLDWRNSLINTGFHGYQAEVSICPECSKVVEFRVKEQLQYEEPVMGEYEILENYAYCFRSYSVEGLNWILSDDFHYLCLGESSELDLNEYLNYLPTMFESLQRDDSKIMVDLLNKLVILTLDGNNVAIGVKIENGKIVRAEMKPIHIVEDEPSPNEFIAKCNQFHELLNKEIVVANGKENGRVFECLSSLKLKDGVRMELHVSKEDGSDDNTYFFIPNGEKYGDCKLFKYINAEPSEMSAWEVYLLMTSESVMPFSWHGDILSRDFIFKKIDFVNSYFLWVLDLSAINDEDLLPKVYLSKDDATGKVTADVYCCFWNVRNELIRERATIVFNGNQVESYNAKTDFVLYKNERIIYY